MKEHPQSYQAVLRHIREYNRKLEKTKEIREKNQPMFLGLMYCGDCGIKMRFHRHTFRGKTHLTYDCGGWARKQCDKGTHNIREDTVKSIIWNVLQTQMSLCCDLEKVAAVIQGGTDTGKLAEYRAEIQRLSVQLKSRQAKRERLYEDFSDGRRN